MINPDLLTSAKRLQYEGYLRREETNAEIMKQIKAEVPLRRIVKNSGHSRKVVRAVARDERSDVLRNAGEFAGTPSALVERAMGQRSPERDRISGAGSRLTA